MVIKASSAGQVEALVGDLSADSEVKRETAVARLTLAGARAVDRLGRLAGEGNVPATARAAALRTLEAIGDRRGLAPGAAAIDDVSLDVACAGISLVASFLAGPEGAAALDRLTAVALDAAKDERVRAAAIAALSGLDKATLKPLWLALKDDPSTAMRALAEKAGRKPASTRTSDPLSGLEQAADTALPDDPAALRRDLAAAGDRLPLPRLHRLIERVREREAAEPPSARADWTVVRAAAHVALAARDSRLGVYDLRESLESAKGPLPVEFLTALAMVGDQSCLEAIAGAYARAAAPGRSRPDWWRQHLADAFRAIVSRERITRRHAVMKKIEKRWPEVISTL